MPTIQTRDKYLSLFPSTSEALAFEQQVLSVGREFLPAQAILVLQGVEPSPEYWQFLADSLATAEGEHEDRMRETDAS